jgi:LmbE family N-acetylglucosaminyl deacetylase
MLKTKFSTGKGSGFKVLCLGAHSDDIEIGCGGTILQMIQDYPKVEMYWVVFSAEGVRVSEANKSANQFLKGVGKKQIELHDFRDSFFPYNGYEIKEIFFELKKKYEPDVIFTHYRGDLHQDHRLISELTWNTFRDHLILEYEIPKYDGDLGGPNTFMHLTKSICQRKLRYLLGSFKSQRKKRWFAEDTFLSMLRIRGMESNSPSAYAEAFHSRKILL